MLIIIYNHINLCKCFEMYTHKISTVRKIILVYKILKKTIRNI
jgi:hypothetical protein